MSQQFALKAAFWSCCEQYDTRIIWNKMSIEEKYSLSKLCDEPESFLSRLESLRLGIGEEKYLLMKSAYRRFIQGK